MAVLEARDVEQRLERAYYELANEGRLARVGLKERQETAPIVERYRELYTHEQIAAIGAERDAADGDRRDELTRVYNALLDGYIDARAASLNDRVVTSLATASAEIDGESFPFYNLTPTISRTDDPMRRERLLSGMVQVLEPRNELLGEQQKAIEEAIGDLGFKGYYDYFATVKAIDYPRFAGVVEQVLASTNDLYWRHVGAWTRDAVGRDLAGLSCAHFYWLRRNQVPASLFPKERLEGALRDSLWGLGIDIDAQPNIHVDSEDRPTKNPRACVIPARVPDEVHLITKPSGGKEDFDAFFHEAGHAEHFANTNPALPFAYRLLARTMAHTELFSYMMENLVNDPLWLETYLGFSPEQAEFVAYRAALMDLTLLRRYCSKYLYEYRYFTDGGDGPELYSSIIRRHTGFAYPPSFWQYDRDAGFYSADYLRAWFGHAQVQTALREQFGPRWWADQEAGRVVIDLWREGAKPDIEDVVQRMGASPWDPSALEAYYCRRIADSPVGRDIPVV